METVSWKRVIDHSDALSRAGCASCVYNNRYVLIFGGRSKSTFFIDCLSLDTKTGNLSSLTPDSQNTNDHKTPKISPRAHHSATIIKDTAWIVGGGNESQLADDAILCFDITKKQWTIPTMKGDTHLLKRTAHGACIHPLKPSCILLFGGYTSSNEKDRGQWLQDLVLIDTTTLHVSSIQPEGPLPTARAFHSFTAVSQRLCISLFGRSAPTTLISSVEAPAIYDAHTNKWILSERPGGKAPAARASHRACIVPGGIAMYGGAPARSTQARLADLRYLTIDVETSGSNGGVSGGGVGLTMKWLPVAKTTAQSTAATGGGIIHDGDDDDIGDDNEEKHHHRNSSHHVTQPAGRAAHVLECIDNHIYVLAGYGDEKKYAADAWCIDSAIHGTTSLLHHNNNNNNDNDNSTIITTGTTTITNDTTDQQHVSPEWRVSKRKFILPSDNQLTPIPDSQQPKKVKESVPKAHPLSNVLAMALSNKETSPKGKPLSSSLLLQSPQKQHASMPIATPMTTASTMNVNNGTTSTSQATRKQVTHVTQLEQQVYDLKRAVERYATIEKTLLDEKKKLENELQRTTSDLRKNEYELNESRKSCNHWKELVGEHRTLLSKAEQQAKDDVHAIKKEKESQLKALRSDLQIEKTAKRTVEEENNRLLRQVQDMQASLLEERNTSDRLRDQHASLLEQNNTLQQQLTVATNSVTALQVELDRVKADTSMMMTTMREEKQRTDKELAMVKERLNTALDESIEHRHHRTSLETELRLNEDELMRIKARLKREIDSKDELESKIRKMSDDIDALNAEKSSLVKAVASERARNERNMDAVKDVLHRWHGSGGGDN